MTDFDLTQFLPYQLAAAAQRISREFAETYRRDFGISIPEWRVLAHLNQEGAVSVRDIQLRVDMDKSKVSRAASRLEASGYVTKLANASDGRLVSLSLSPEGQALMDRLVPVALAYQAALSRRLGPAAAGLVSGLGQILEEK